MKEVSQSNSLLKLAPKTGPHQTTRPTAPPADQFVGAEVSPEWLFKPAKVALIGATLAMGVASAAPVPGEAQVQLSTRQAEKALNQLNFLDQVAEQQGGTLRSESPSLLGQVFRYQPDVEPAEALANLTQGYTLYFTPSADSATIAIHSAQELKQVTSEFREQQLERSLKGSMQSLGRSLDILGDEIGELF